MSNAHQYGGTPPPAAETRDNGRQTPQQAVITGQGAAGKMDAERNAEWRDASGDPSVGSKPGRSPVAVGGSSQGQSDQNDGRSPDGGKVAGGSAATSDATAAETPPENLRRISDPSLPRPEAADALDCATASVGKDEEDRP